MNSNIISNSIDKYGNVIQIKYADGNTVSSRAFVEPLRYRHKMYISGKERDLDSLKHIKKKYLYVGQPNNVDYTGYPIEADDENRVIAILSIEFMDADNPGDYDVYGSITTIDDFMTDEDAKKIVAFVEQYKDKRILVHCDAGISRSSAVVAAILKHYTGNDDMIFDSRWYNPNRWVYRKVLEAFEIDNGEVD